MTAHIPVRFAATKLVEGDELVTEALHLDRNELDAIEHIITQMEGEAGHRPPVRAGRYAL